MKILSAPQGDGPLTNVEVLQWLREKNFDNTKRNNDQGATINPPVVVANIAHQVRKYIETSPAANVSVSAVQQLFKKLEKFKLSPPELVMIVNIRPEAYAHLTPLITDVYSRYEEDQLVEILEIINSTLEKRQKDDKSGSKPSAAANDQSNIVPADSAAAEADIDGHTGIPASISEAPESAPNNKLENTLTKPEITTNKNAEEEDNDDAAMLDIDDAMPEETDKNLALLDIDDAPAAMTVPALEIPVDGTTVAPTPFGEDVMQSEPSFTFPANAVPSSNAPPAVKVGDIKTSDEKNTAAMTSAYTSGQTTNVNPAPKPTGFSSMCPAATTDDISGLVAESSTKLEAAVPKGMHNGGSDGGPVATTTDISQIVGAKMSGKSEATAVAGGGGTPVGKKVVDGADAATNGDSTAPAALTPTNAGPKDEAVESKTELVKEKTEVSNIVTRPAIGSTDEIAKVAGKSPAKQWSAQSDSTKVRIEADVTDLSAITSRVKQEFARKKKLEKFERKNEKMAKQMQEMTEKNNGNEKIDAAATDISQL